jgi:pectin methylesterase-like acyl-CoA thioesterase
MSRGLRALVCFAGCLAIIVLLAPLAGAQATKVVTVAQAGGDFTDPGAAVASILDASAANPYLVRVLPGVYTVASQIVMKPYVDLEGSGEGVTKIIGAADGAGLLFCCANSELRLVTVENTGAGARSVAVGGTAFSLFKVTAIAANGTTDTYGIYGSGPGTRKLRNVTAKATGGPVATGIQTHTGTLDFDDVVASAKIGRAHV